ncbi:MAG: cytochrome c peroxidase [Acuticoccus sp.]
MQGDQACVFCHMPYTGFSGPVPSINATMSAYPGSTHFRSTDRTPMRYGYASRYNVLQYNRTQGDFYGGNFWDGRATGLLLQNPNAEQATDPPVSAGEMGFPDVACIVYRLSQAEYRPLFEAIWGVGALEIDWPADVEDICTTPAGSARFGDNAEPVRLSADDRLKVASAFDHWGQTASFYQSGDNVSPFSSKFDAYLAGDYTMTADEQAGYALFRGKATCNSCHLDGVSTVLDDGTADTGAAADVAPFFTDETYVNLGLPLNPRLPLFYEDTPDAYGFTANPFGFGHRDLGMGNFLRSVHGINPNAAWDALAPDFDGAFQTTTARNAALTPLACPTTEAGRVDANGEPVPYFQKSFFHNGYIKSLKQLVHFYNTRDKYAYPVTSGNCPQGTTEKVGCWPKPEVPNNVDDTIGDLGLSDAEEDKLVAFLETLSDGYTRPYPNRDLYSGQCRTGGSAATQGNDLLIATPALPPCADALCGVAPSPAPPIE